MNNRIITATFLLLLTVGHQGLSTPAIGFSAVLTHNAYLGNNQAIIYGNVLTNVGYGYNKWSGHFTVPRKGLYVFSCKSVYSPETASGTVVFALKKGDNVWVRRLDHGRRIEGYHNYFSGYRISAEI